MKRRFFLKSAAGTLLAAPFLTSLREPAVARAARPPQRSVIFHSPCGCLTTRWFPKVEDGPLDAAALAGTTLDVLTPWVDKLLFPRGVRAINQYGKLQTIDPRA
ncbi:MAG TPA: Tat pathway signal sequence, partial [Polyangiaceae bacterium]